MNEYLPSGVHHASYSTDLSQLIMRTPSPRSGPSHSVAVAALLQLSQTPPQSAVTPRELKQHSTDATPSSIEPFRYDDQGDAVVSTPKPSKSDTPNFASPLSGPAGIIKVSNSDDEDVSMRVRDAYRNDSYALQAPYAVSRNEIRSLQISPAVPTKEISEPTYGIGMAAINTPNTEHLYKSPYADIHTSGYMSAESTASAQPTDESSQLSAQLPQTALQMTTVGEDEPEMFLSHTALLKQQASSRPAFNPGELYSLPNSHDMVSSNQAFSGFNEGRRKVQIPRAPSRTQSKRVRVPGKSQVAVAHRDGFGPKLIDIRDFKYRTIKSINMPVRTDVIAGQDPPEPTPISHPYGSDIDYRAGMLIWLCDDLELSYSETVRRYRLKFPDEKSITEDAVRKRHILFLEKLARRYGLKPEHELDEPGRRVAIRGRQIGHKYNTINGVHVYAASAGHDVAGTVRRRRTSDQLTMHRGFLKACICVWKDTSNASIEEIKQRLQNDYGWNIGVNTVNKLYYSERARVYDTHNTSTASNQEASIETADEDLEQLQAHYHQRYAYLLKTHGQQVPVQDVEYMQQLEQLIHSSTKAQSQRAHHSDGGPIWIGQETFKEVRDVGEGDEGGERDVMMPTADADPGDVVDQGNESY